MLNTTYLRVAGIEPESVVDGEGIRYVIFTQGCPHHCPGCHNPKTHDFDGGIDVSVAQIVSDITDVSGYIDGITLSGGEPFCQQKACRMIAKEAHNMGLSVWCYTGYSYEDLIEFDSALLRDVDVLVDGPFLIGERSLSLKYCGSKNQRVINVPASLRVGKVVLADI